jgi:hypothetical protein
LIDHSSTAEYTLQNRDGTTISKASPEEGRLLFSLPVGTETTPPGPLYLSGPEGGYRLSGIGDTLTNRLWQEHHQLLLDATAEQQKLVDLQQKIAAGSSRRDSAIRWLEERPELYQSSDGCLTPPTERPLLACGPEESAMMATSICASVMGDCNSLIHLTRNKQIIDALNDQQCNRQAEALQESNHPWRERIASFTPPADDPQQEQMASSKNPMIQAFGMMYKAKLLKESIQRFGQCLNQMKSLCQRLEQEWQNGAEEMREQCQSMVETRDQEEELSATLTDEAKESQESLNKMIEELNALQQEQITLGATTQPE